MRSSRPAEVVLALALLGKGAALDFLRDGGWPLDAQDLRAALAPRGPLAPPADDLATTWPSLPAEEVPPGTTVSRLPRVRFHAHAVGMRFQQWHCFFTLWSFR